MFQYYLAHPNEEWLCDICGLPNLSHSYFNEDLPQQPYNLMKPVNLISRYTETDVQVGLSRTMVRGQHKQLLYKSNLKIGHLNINGIHNKMDEVLEMLNKKMFDILFISETKIGDTTSDSLLNQPNYRLLRRDLKKGAGGLMRMYVQTYQYTGDESSNLKKFRRQRH